MHWIAVEALGKGPEYGPTWPLFRFFAMQGVGVLLEGAFRKATGRRTKGLWGRLWTWSWIFLWAPSAMEVVSPRPSSDPQSAETHSLTCRAPLAPSLPPVRPPRPDGRHEPRQSERRPPVPVAPERAVGPLRLGTVLEWARNKEKLQSAARCACSCKGPPEPPHGARACMTGRATGEGLHAARLASKTEGQRLLQAQVDRGRRRRRARRARDALPSALALPSHVHLDPLPSYATPLAPPNPSS